MRIQGAGEGLVDDQEGQGEQVVYILHPNCAVEEIE
jgi:hypothetical protein